MLNMVARILFIIFSILYLVTIALVLWFLLYYSGVPSWVWILFGIAISIAIISLIMKEFAFNEPKTTKTMNVWSVLYILMQIVAVILIIVGLIFVIKYSNIPWWVWVILGAAILLNFLAGIMVLLGVPFIGIILAVFGFIASVIGTIFLITYSGSPWWIWLLLIVSVIFSMLASIFENISHNQEITTEKRVECISTPDVITCTEKIIPVALPSSNIPEQIII